MELSTTVHGLSKAKCRLFDAALQEAETSDMLQRHGAVLFRHGRVVSTGHNHHRSRMPKLMRTLLDDELCTSTHAEVDCISRALQALGGGQRREKSHRPLPRKAPEGFGHPF